MNGAGSKRDTTRLQALCGLLRYPALTQREIADRIGLKLSTLNAIKLRLERDGLYRSVSLPMGAPLGYTHLAASWRKQTLRAGLDVLRGVEEAIAMEARHTFLALHENFKAFSLGYHRGAEEGTRHLGAVRDAYARRGLDLVPAETLHLSLPLAGLEVYRLFDFSAAVAQAAGLPVERPGAEAAPGARGTVEGLSALQRRLLLLLTDTPESTDSAAAERLGTSRQSVARAREGLVASGMVRLARIPDPAKVGLPHLTFSLAEYDAPLEARRAGIAWGLREMPIAYLAATESQALSCLATSGYDAHAGLLARLPPKYVTGAYAVRSLTTRRFTFPTASAVRWFDTRPLVEDALAGAESRG